MTDFNGILPNGTALYTALNPRLSLFCLTLWVRRGAMHNAPEEVGLAHFLEHILFRSLSERMGGRLYGELRAHGLDLDACTSDAYVRFDLTGPTSAFDAGLELLLGVLEPPLVSLEGLHRERLRIQAEIRENDNDNSYDQAIRRHIWAGTPLSRTIDGSVNAANRVGFDALTREHARWFRRSGFFFGATGNIPDPQVLVHRLSGMSLPDALAPDAVPVPDAFFHRDAQVELEVQSTPHLVFAFDVPAAHLSPAALNMVQDELLRDCGALYVALSEDTGLTYGIDGYLQHHAGVASLTFDFSVEPTRVEEAVERTMDVLNAMKALPDDRCEALRDGFIANEIQKADYPLSLAYDWCFENGILDQGWPSFEARLSALKTVTPDALRQVFRSVFRPENAILCAYGSPRRIRPERLRELLLQLGEA